VVNVINVVNTNITDSETFWLFLNYLNGHNGDVVLPEIGKKDCPDGCGEGADLSISNNNDGQIINDIQVEAVSGNNRVDGANRSFIGTGNALAAANVANIMNSNIVNSNYLLLVMNSFNNWSGNLILPPSSFFSNGTNSTIKMVKNDNSATVMNNVSTTAETGDNSVSGGDRLIDTGGAFSATNLLNIANSNYVNSDRIFVLIRVIGNWTGDVYSAPPGLSWERTTGGIVLYSKDMEDIAGGDGCCQGDTRVSNANAGSISNNVKVYALTGDNEIISNSGEGSITTGNAVASVNIFNMVNTNIVGRNWLLAMVNVFGDWNGSVAFGQPDLWIGGRAELDSNPIKPGSDARYTINLVNRGNADATNVRITNNFSRQDLISLENISSGGGQQSDGSVSWQIPRLKAGESASVSYSFRAKGTLPAGTSLLESNVQVISHEPDANSFDNRDSLSFALAGDILQAVGRPGGAGAGTARLKLTKVNSVSTPISPSSTVRYTLKLRNEGTGSAFDTVVTDRLQNPFGRTLSTNSWQLGIVYPGEEINIEYDTHFSDRAPKGYYINYADVTATDNYYLPIRGPKASSSIYIVVPEVATAPPATIIVGGGGGSQQEDINPTGVAGDLSTASTSDQNKVSNVQPNIGAPDDEAGSVGSITDESVIEDDMSEQAQLIEQYEPIRHYFQPEEAPQAESVNSRDKLLASVLNLPLESWMIFLMVIFLIAIGIRFYLTKEDHS